MDEQISSFGEGLNLYVDPLSGRWIQVLNQDELQEMVRGESATAEVIGIKHHIADQRKGLEVLAARYLHTSHLPCFGKDISELVYGVHADYRAEYGNQWLTKQSFDKAILPLMIRRVHNQRYAQVIGSIGCSLNEWAEEFDTGEPDELIQETMFHVYKLIIGGHFSNDDYRRMLSSSQCGYQNQGLLDNGLVRATMESVFEHHISGVVSGPDNYSANRLYVESALAQIRKEQPALEEAVYGPWEVVEVTNGLPIGDGGKDEIHLQRRRDMQLWLEEITDRVQG
ncbi:MAG: hypothetical protein ABIH64_03820 [Nanoarchaeota archaeon]